jgi:hypothetical protein
LSFLVRDVHFSLSPQVEINLEESSPPLSGSDDVTQFRLDEEQQKDTPAPQSDMIGKLDEMMDLMFEYVQSTLSRSPEELNPLFGAMQSGGDWLFESVMRIFESLVLLTHKCKFTQFMVFFMCSRTPEYARAFLSYLTAVAVDAKRDPTTRLSCVAYLGSFLARANFLSFEYATSITLVYSFFPLTVSLSLQGNPRYVIVPLSVA